MTGPGKRCDGSASVALLTGEGPTAVVLDMAAQSCAERCHPSAVNGAIDECDDLKEERNETIGKGGS
jgi:hypothetical protein